MSLRQFFCWHVHYRRDRDGKGVSILVCDACGRTVPVIERTTKERKAMGKKYQPVALPVARPVDAPAKVTPMWRAK